MIISGDAIEAGSSGYTVRLSLASVQDVAIDDMFVVMIIDPTLHFAIPKRCLGDDASVEAFGRFIESRRASASPPPQQ